MRSTLLAGVVVSLALLTGPAFGVDGVIELNQDRALAGGPGDPPGFPVEIESSGSYRLTSDLVVAGSPLSPPPAAVLIKAPHVMLDLNGFSIRCTFVVIDATPCNEVAGSGSNGGGVVSSARGVWISNGTIRDSALHGIGLLNDFVVQRVRLVNNGRDGAFVLGSGQFIETHAIGNGGAGIRVGSEPARVMILDSLTRENGSYGLQVESGQALLGTTSLEDGLATVGTGSVVYLACSMNTGVRICPP